MPNMNQLPSPSIEELRMLRAIVLIALADAACRGEYRASFRGYRVHAWRIVLPSRGFFVPVRVETRCGRVVLERSDVDVACAWQSASHRIDMWVAEPNPWPVVC